MNTKTKVKLASGTARTMAEHPGIRRAASTVAPPVAKAGFRIGRRRARRRALAQAERLQEMARSAGETLATYGPPAAEALGLTEPPKKSRVAPAMAFGAVLGGAVVLFLEPQGGSARRAKVQQMVAGRKQAGAYS